MAAATLSNETLFPLLNQASSQASGRLVCHWVYPETGSECNMSYDDVDLLLTHIRSTHSSTFSTGGAVCLWKLCGYSSVHPNELHCHLLYHGYHCLLKAKGEDFINQKKLQSCHMSSVLTPGLTNSRVVFPKTVNEEGWRCLWYERQVVCGLTYTCAKTYYDHVKKHVEDSGEYKCYWEDCSFKGTSKWKLSDHVRTHTQERVIACPTCGTLFSNTTKFKDHIDRQVIPSDSAHTCSICHKSFNTDRLLCQHIRKHVNTQKCPYCEMTCATPSALTYHLHYRHTQGKPHQCPICSNHYKTHYALADHMKIHRAKDIHCEKPGCGYSTTTIRNYKRHLQSEHGDGTMVYCCHICEERFTQGKKLTSHLKSLHGFSLPPGHSRFRYIESADGTRRLQTVRLIDKGLATTSSTNA